MVATANAQLLDIARFCTHHLNEGAVTIDIYFDNPKRNVIEAMHSLPQIRVLSTDWHHCRNKGKTPENIEQR